jgi:FkbM family methyltransferase
MRFTQNLFRFATNLVRLATQDSPRLYLGTAIQVAIRLSALRLSAKGRPPRRIRIPSGSRSVYLRPGTTDVDVFEQIFVQRQYDMRSFPHFKSLSHHRPEDILILDCGAYTGLSTIWFAETFPGARVYAVEPDAENYATLVRNTRDLPNVTPVNAAVWDRECRLVVDNPGPDVPKWSVRIAESDEDRTTTVEAVTIAKLVASAGNHSCIIVKLDVEGGESAVFRGNTEWLAATNVLLIELHDWLYPWQYSSRNFFSAILKHYFDVLLLGENLICFQKIAALPTSPMSAARIRAPTAVSAIAASS